MLRTAKTENGEVRGLPASNPRITVYKGIPFAAPPVGKNRWRAPQPCENWEGIRNCYEFAPGSIQDTPGLGDNIYVKEWSDDPEVPMDEDCLYLNIWTPAKKVDAKLPVYVWYFGGGLQWGFPFEMEFDGENLAKRGVIVVSVNYRLGALGFMAHPELTKEQPEGPANFGNLDQHAGLMWVVRNIAAFGGDPENITIGGQSAGGGSTLWQLTCEKNFGHIQHAIIMSGVFRSPKINDPILAPCTLERAEKNGVDFLEFLGVKNIEEARALPALTIRDKYAQYASNHPRFASCIDGVNCKADPFENYIRGNHADADLMLGNTMDEFPMPIEDEGETRKSCGIEYAAKAMCEADSLRNAKKTYYYKFDSDIPGEDHPGTFHSVDLWFFFESLRSCWRPMVGRHYDLARKMCNYWANFMKTGNPNGADCDGTPMPEWKACTAEEHNEMVFTGNGPEPRVEKDAFIGRIVERMRKGVK